MPTIREENESSFVNSGSPGEQLTRQFSEIDVMAIEAETLLHSIQATYRLLKEDTQSFIDIRLDQRIEIFTQMTQILNLSMRLCDMIPNRELKQHQQGLRKG